MTDEIRITSATAIFGLIAQTSIHAGAGSSVAGVDLPIQREGHNGWPCVFGSAVKGALRSKAEAVYTKGSADVLAVFGPETSKASDNAGAIAVGDARLLLLPVRSLTTEFKWVTCAEALKRLQRDTDRMGLASEFTFNVPEATGTEARVVAGNGALFLEEYRFTLNPDNDVAPVATAVAKLMKRNMAEAELRQRMVIVSNDMFSHLTQAAIPLNAHIALDSSSKTTCKGALWYEETLPPETLLYVPLLANKSRKADHVLSAADVLGKVSGLFSEEYAWLQIGGNETVGMGWCAIAVLKGA